VEKTPQNVPALLLTGWGSVGTDKNSSQGRLVRLKNSTRKEVYNEEITLVHLPQTTGIKYTCQYLMAWLG